MKTLDLYFSKHPFLRVLPALLMMVAIFLFSARPSTDESFDLLKRIIYKSGHVIGYALLALSYWRAFQFDPARRWLAWLLAILYALTDEFHQLFVPGRNGTLFDVFVYDNAGALLVLWLAGFFTKQKQPTRAALAVEDAGR